VTGGAAGGNPIQGRPMTAPDDPTSRLDALQQERDRLRERIAELEDALQSCLSRARY